MSDATTVTDEVTPPSDTTEQPFDEEPTDTVESLKEKLAAEMEEKKKALDEAKRWKNRVKEENPPTKKEGQSSEDDEYTDWRIDNRDRIALVKEQYEQELDELQSYGSKLSVAVREKALRLAEKNAGVKDAPKSEDEPLPAASIERGGSRQPRLTEHDVAFGIKPETKKKYAHLVEGGEW